MIKKLKSFNIIDDKPKKRNLLYKNKKYFL